MGRDLPSGDPHCPRCDECRHPRRHPQTPWSSGGRMLFCALSRGFSASTFVLLSSLNMTYRLMSSSQGYGKPVGVGKCPGGESPQWVL